MDKSYAQRVNFKDYAVRMMKTLEYGMAFCGKECMMVKV